MKKIIPILVIILFILPITGCRKQDKVPYNTIRIGMQDSTENLIIGELFALALEDAGYQVVRVTNIPASTIHTSIVNDEIDLYPEYTMTGLLLVLQKDMVLDPDYVYRIVKNAYQKQFSLTWLDYAKANSGKGLVIRTELVNELGISTISDLQLHASDIRFISQEEFIRNEDGLMRMEEMYGIFKWKSSLIYDNELTYSLLANDEADVMPANITDGQLVNSKYTLLEDDKQIWSEYNIAPVVRQSVLEEYPNIKSRLNAIIATLDTSTLTALNAAVDMDNRGYEEVAEEYYEQIK